MEDDDPYSPLTFRASLLYGVYQHFLNEDEGFLPNTAAFYAQIDDTSHCLKETRNPGAHYSLQAITKERLGSKPPIIRDNTK